MQYLRRRSEMNAVSGTAGSRGAEGWFQRLVTSGFSLAKQRREMEVVETLSLGGRGQLMLVACAGERFLVGAGANGVQTIVPVRGERGVDVREQDAL